VNEKPTSKSSLDLTLMQHPCDEDPKPREVRVHLEVDPPRTWYYRIFLNFRTMVILLQVDHAFGDESKIIYEVCCKIENTSIFAWYSILDIRHYRWLCGPTRQLLLNNKVDSLVRTIQCILDFLQL
jgi:hypothetical protein